MEELNFMRRHTDICSQVNSWVAEVKVAKWQNLLDIKKRYVSASFLKDNHVIFNLKGNKYRLKVKVHYRKQIVMIKDIGTHQEYMKWN